MGQVRDLRTDLDRLDAWYSVGGSHKVARELVELRVRLSRTIRVFRARGIGYPDPAQRPDDLVVTP